MDEELNQNELGFALGIKKQVFNNEIRKRREQLGLNQEELPPLYETWAEKSLNTKRYCNTLQNVLKPFYPLTKSVENRIIPYS